MVLLVFYIKIYKKLLPSPGTSVFKGPGYFTITLGSTVYGSK